jgi:hypothetical protein
MPIASPLVHSSFQSSTNLSLCHLRSFEPEAFVNHFEVDHYLPSRTKDPQGTTVKMVSKTRVYNWYISLVAASCMVLYGYDASVFNALQNSKNWVAYYDNPSPNIIGAINTAYTVGAVVAGFFMV